MAAAAPGGHHRAALISELVSNAVHASKDFTAAVAPLRLWLCSDGHRVVIQVWDASPQIPVKRDTEPETESGRGLLLVEALSAGWGSYQLAGSGGKVVWAVVA